MVAAPKRRNCLGVGPPKRLPRPPAGLTTASLAIVRDRRLLPRAGEDHAARRGLQDARHHDLERPADRPSSPLPDEHRAVAADRPAPAGLLPRPPHLDRP